METYRLRHRPEELVHDGDVAQHGHVPIQEKEKRRPGAAPAARPVPLDFHGKSEHVVIVEHR